MPAAVRPVTGPVRAALDELGERHEAATAHLTGALRATEAAVRTQIEGVRDDVRTGAGAVREAIRTEAEAVRDAIRAEPARSAPGPAPVDRDAIVADLAGQIRDAISSGEQWTPAYGELMARTGYSRSWCEKAARDARSQVFTVPSATEETS